LKSSAKKIELASVDDLFSTEEGRQDAKLEKIQEIPLSELHPFRNHPFKVKDDEAMMETADSIKQYGVLVPAIARPDPEGGYELVTNGVEFEGAYRAKDKDLLRALARDLEQKDPWVLLSRPMKEADGFVEQSLSERASERRARKVSYILLGVALLSGVLFLLAVVFSPLFLTIPSFATAPALIIVGFYMMGSALKIEFDDPAEGIPAFLTILAMPTAYSISEGIAIGVISWTLLNVITGKAKEKKISPLMYVLTVLFILKYVLL